MFVVYRQHAQSSAKYRQAKYPNGVSHFEVCDTIGEAIDSANEYMGQYVIQYSQADIDFITKDEGSCPYELGVYYDSSTGAVVGREGDRIFDFGDWSLRIEELEDPEFGLCECNVEVFTKDKPANVWSGDPVLVACYKLPFGGFHNVYFQMDFHDYIKYWL